MIKQTIYIYNTIFTVISMIPIIYHDHDTVVFFLKTIKIISNECVIIPINCYSL